MGTHANPAALSSDADSGFTAAFRDVPEAITVADTQEEALLRAGEVARARACYVRSC